MRRSLPIVILCLMPAAALAESLSLDAPIAAVTVYLQGADVVREGRADLPAGRHTLVVSGLPAGLDPNTVRLGADGSERLTLGAVEAVQRFGPEAPSAAERRLEEEIRGIEAEIRALRDRVAAQEIKLDAIRTTGKGMAEEGPGMEAWQSAWAILLEGAEAALGAIRTTEEEIKVLRRVLEAKRRELEGLVSEARATTELRVAIEAERAGPVDLRLGYGVEDAGWEPAYDLRADSETGTLVLAGFANVRQGTGEPWPDVALTLAGTRPRGWTALPDLRPWRIDVVERPEALARQMGLPAPKADMAKAVAAEAAVEATPLVTRFVVPGTATIPQDRSPRRVPLLAFEDAFALDAVTAPRLAPEAVLEAEVANPTGATLPAGSLRLMRDGAVAAQAWLDTFPPNETRKLPLGADERIEVAYRLDTTNKGGSGFFGRDRREVRRFVIEATNRHDAPVDLRVLDQHPVPVDERIEVELADDTTPPDVRDVEGEEGVMAWDLRLEPGETRTIRFGWVVTFPEDLRVGGL